MRWSRGSLTVGSRRFPTSRPGRVVDDMGGYLDTSFQGAAVVHLWSTCVFGAKAKAEAEATGTATGAVGWRRVADWVVPGRTMGRQVARRTPLGHGVIRRRRVDMDRLDAFRDQLLREGEVRKLSASGEGCPLGTGDARGHGGCAVDVQCGQRQPAHV